LSQAGNRWILPSAQIASRREIDRCWRGFSGFPNTAPALVIVGSMMMRNVTKIDWSDYTEAMPAFLIVIGIPLTFSIADGLALGFIAYPIIKLCTGKGRTVNWLMYVMAAVLLAYFLMVRVQVA
jgi:AGZA family xanthine/uracil permease-like MFS transporter